MLTADSLVITGSISRLRAFTDYGVKLHHARDSTGKTLGFKSAQILWMKGMFVEIEIERPSPGADSVDMDVSFYTRSGAERIRQTIEFDPTKTETTWGSRRSQRRL